MPFSEPQKKGAVSLSKPSGGSSNPGGCRRRPDDQPFGRLPGFARKVRERTGLQMVHEFGITAFGLILLLIHLSGTARAIFPYFALAGMGLLALTLVLGIIFYIKERSAHGTPAATCAAVLILVILATIFTYITGYSSVPDPYGAALSDIMGAVEDPLGFIGIIKGWAG